MRYTLILLVVLYWAVDAAYLTSCVTAGDVYAVVFAAAESAIIFAAMVAVYRFGRIERQRAAVRGESR